MMPLYQVFCPNNCKMTVCGYEMKSCAYISDKEDEIVKCSICGAIMYYPCDYELFE